MGGPVLDAVLIAVSVLLGSVPTGVLLARSRGVDLRQVGSGNIGATNVGRALGKKWGVVVLLVDAAKGWAPVFVADQLDRGPWTLAAVGVAAVAGHSFSIFLRGRGGKGVATSLGAALAIAPVPALCCFGVYAALYAAFRISSIGSMTGVAAFPVFLWLFGIEVAAYYVFGTIIAALVILRHRDNIRRLRKGEELKA
jgi:glycerol-3-phosphate acyltransferase PlsY